MVGVAGLTGFKVIFGSMMSWYIFIVLKPIKALFTNKRQLASHL